MNFKLPFYIWLLLSILESYPCSFIGWSHANLNRNFNFFESLTFNFDVDAGCSFHYRGWILPTSTRIVTNSRIFSSGASPSYGNNAHSPYANDSSNNNEPLEITIIGPLLNVQKPIIIGKSVWLDPPTPMQWKSVEASVEAQHGGTVMAWKSSTASDIDESMACKLNLAKIGESPLVAILHCGGKEYATIAAVEGMVTKKGSIDTSDAESFRESLAAFHSHYYSDSSKIRLMAIGRAKVSHFTTKFLQDDTFDEYDELNRSSISSIAPEPILVARMKLLFDSNDKGKSTSSPVHALNRVSKLAQRVRFLQDDRQRIVRGLHAAQSILEMAMGDWEDWDGIGSIRTDLTDSSTLKTAKSESVDHDIHTTVLDQFLKEYHKDENAPLSPTHSLPLSPCAARCMNLDNYGLGTTSGALVSLTSMADALMENLEKYYSPNQTKSEEFEYEVFSWCALRSLETYLSPQEINDALYKCTNTCSRLEIIYHAMIKHKMDLIELAQAKSLELRNCGEECDLF